MGESSGKTSCSHLKKKYMKIHGGCDAFVTVGFAGSVGWWGKVAALGVIAQEVTV